MSLMYRILENAKIQAYDPPIVRAPQGFIGGLVLESENDAALRHTRAHKAIDLFRENEIYERRLPGEYAYAGPIYGHFGHFMAEMVHRIVPSLRNNPDLPFIFVSTKGWDPHPNYAQFPEFVKNILSFLNIAASRVRVVSQNTIVERLHVFESGSDLVGGPKPGYTDMLREFSLSRLKELYGRISRPRKIYVSRSALVPQGMILGESYFEDQLAKDGFTVLRPEEISFTAQIDYYHKAETIIFPEGSACHGTELLGSRMMNDVHLFPRRRGQLAPFVKILSPRSKNITIMEDCVEYLGTASVRREDGMPLSHLGVSGLTVDKMLRYLRKHGLADLARFSVSSYTERVQQDLISYREYQSRPGAPYNEIFYSELENKVKLYVSDCLKSAKKEI
jgi:hypothetical protein